MAERQQALAKVILEDPAVESLSTFIGVDGSNPTLNSGRFLINLKPLGQRKGRVMDVIRRLQDRLAEVGGITLYMQPVQDLTIDERVTRGQYQVSVEDVSADVLRTWVPKFLARLREDPRLAEVATDQQEGGLQVYVEIDRAAAARHGVTPSMVSNALYNAFGQRPVSTIYTQTSQFRVVLEVMPTFQAGPSALDSIYLTSTQRTQGAAAGKLQQVPLSAVARISERTAPLVVNRAGQFSAATISFNLGRGASLGDAVKAVEKAQRTSPFRRARSSGSRAPHSRSRRRSRTRSG